MPKARVLVVDDVPTNLDVTKGIMSPYGMQIDCVSSGYEAIDAIREENVRYDAIFMDHMMPEMDGIETTRIIREEIGSDYAKNVPIIALTANAIIGNEEIFLSKGFQAFISKPIDVIQLDSILNTWVKKKIDAAPIEFPQDEKPEIFKDISIDGVDFAEGLERFGSEAAYLSVIRSFCLHTPDLLEQMRSLATNEIPFQEYKVIAHGLKGSCRGISAEHAAAEASKLEIAGKDEDSEQIKTGTLPFISMMESLLTDFNRLLEKAASCGEIKNSVQAPDSILLSDLHYAASQYKATSMEQILKELESYKYESGGDLIIWLREQMDNLEYDKIKTKLEKELHYEQ
jgi:CheY-like chemotaxis protein